MTNRKIIGRASVNTTVIGSRMKSLISTQVNLYRVRILQLLSDSVAGHFQENIFKRWLFDTKVGGDNAVFHKSRRYQSQQRTRTLDLDPIALSRYVFNARYLIQKSKVRFIRRNKNPHPGGVAGDTPPGGIGGAC